MGLRFGHCSRCEGSASASHGDFALGALPGSCLSLLLGRLLPIRNVPVAKPLPAAPRHRCGAEPLLLPAESGRVAQSPRLMLVEKQSAGWGGSLSACRSSQSWGKQHRRETGQELGAGGRVPARCPVPCRRSLPGWCKIAPGRAAAQPRSAAESSEWGKLKERVSRRCAGLQRPVADSCEVMLSYSPPLSGFLL